MKKVFSALFSSAALFATAPASAGEHWDVIELEFQEGCSSETLKVIIADFNKWGEDFGYQARILEPIQTRDVSHFIWVGVSQDAATFGKAYDAWSRDENKPNSAPNKLAKRFGACTRNISRSGYYAH